jgi:AraC-like DNA-binding protein
MNLQNDFHADALRRKLLDRLFGQMRGLGAPRSGGFHPQGEQLFTYCALERERLAATTLDHPLIGVVLRGRKEVWIGDAGEVLLPGMLFSLPKGVRMDVVNIPAPGEGIYESLIFEITGLPAGIASLPRPGGRARPASLALRLSGDLVEAVAHAATAIAATPARGDVKDLRLTEMLALMRADAAARHIFTRSLADELAWRIAARPDHDWTVEEAARDLGLGGSTLRRRLAQSGRSFRAIVAWARMDAARRLIAAGAGAGEAAEAAGYVSRSHFARQYRAAYGTSPSGRTRRKGAG